MKVASILLLTATLVTTGFGLEIYHKSELGPMACGMLIGMLIQPYERYEYQWLDFCDVNNQPALGSMAICLFEGGFSDLQLYLNGFLDSCSHAGLTSRQVFDAYSNATRYVVDPQYYFVQADHNDPTLRYKFPHFELDFPYPVNMTNTTRIQDYFTLLYKDYQSLNWDIYFGISMTAYWFVVMGIAGICNFLYFFCPNYVKSLFGRYINWYRTHITMAPLFHKKHAGSLDWWFGGLLPTRLETIILMGWFILIFAFCFPQINQPIQGLIENAIGDRFADLAIFNFPLLVLFAGRNNFMQWITGWSYSRFLTFHRWVARVVFLLVLLHGIMESIYLQKVHAYTKFGRSPQIVWGYVGITAMSIIVFQSLYILRSSRYELFLLVHILMAIVTIISGWYHTKEVGGIQLFYVTVAIWALDRFIRLCRIISFGVQKATLELKANETIKVTINRPSYWKPYPGAHAFIHFIKPSCFWQSHPFTMIDSVTRANTISFYIKIKGGVSHGLYQQIKKSTDHTLNLRVLVEGPYSQRIPVSNYHNLVFLTGGNGIPGMYFEAIASARSKYKHQKIKLYWIIRHFKSIEWFMPELLKLEQFDIEVVLFITRPEDTHRFIKEEKMTTGSGSGSGSDSDVFNSEFNSSNESPNSFVFQEEIKSPVKTTPARVTETTETLTLNTPSQGISQVKKYHQLMPHVTFILGRPDVRQLVEQDIYDSDHSIAFTTCAHPNMVDEVRLAVRQNLSLQKRIELFEQIQEW